MVGDSFCTIYLVRHGESEANVKKLVQGHSDTALTKRGVEEAERLRDELADIAFSAVYSSDLKRASETAKIVVDGRLKIIETPFLREKNYGVFEGVGHDKFLESLKSEFNRFDNELSDEERWDHKADSSIESDRDLLKRTMSFLETVASENLGKNVLVVTHRFPIRLLLVSVGYASYGDLSSGGVKTGGYAVVKSDGSTFEVIKVSNTEKNNL